MCVCVCARVRVNYANVSLHGLACSQIYTYIYSYIYLYVFTYKYIRILCRIWTTKYTHTHTCMEGLVKAKQINTRINK